MGDFVAICSDESRICTEEEIKTVVDKVDYSNLDQLKYILKSLGNFARQEENRTVLEQGGAAKVAKESLEKGKQDEEILAFAARLIGNMSYDHGDNRLVFLELGVVPEIVKILSSSKHRELTRNATGTLANLASENNEIQKIIVENGGLQVIAQLLASEYPEVVSLALRALNNTSDCVDTQSKIMETNALSNLVEIIRLSEDQDDYVRNTAVEILTTLSSNADVAKALLVDYKLQVVLWKILQEWLARGSWDTEDEDEEPEEGLEEEKPFPISVTLLLVHLANKDPLVQYFWDSQIAIPILEQATKSVTASDGKTQKAKLEVTRNLGRCFALLSLNDATINELFTNLPTIHKLAKSDDPTIRMSALMIYGNMARSDEYCDKLSEHGVVTDIVSAIETYPGDQRIAHVGLSALRNLSIPAKHKTQIVESGGLQIAIQQLSTMNQVIQFEAIGILKCLLLDKTVLNDSKFLELGGLPQVVKLATHATTEGLDENEGKDPRVMFESSRLLCRLVSNDEVRKQIGTDVVGPFTTLVTSNFALLQMEGAQALLNLLTKEEYLPAINNELDRIADTLLALDATANTTTILATLLWEIFEFLNKKGLVEPPVAAKFNDWKTQSQRITPQ